jgi:hypothetical protein
MNRIIEKMKKFSEKENINTVTIYKIIGRAMKRSQGC